MRKINFRNWKSLRFSALVFLVLVSPSVLASSKEELKNAYLLYKKGAYTQAIHVLAKISADTTNQSAIENWLGLCHSRLQAFDQAIFHLERAYQMGSKAEDLEYEIGQAYYASNKLRESRNWFKKSADRGFKVGASLYYIGFVNQILEDYPTALAAYSKIQTLLQDPDNVKQSALLQTAEVKLSQTEALKDEKARKTKIQDEIIAEFQKTVDYNPDSAVGKQAQNRISQLKQMLAPPMLRMRNGTPIAAQAHYVRLLEDLKYDSNVITQADQAVTKVSNTGSFLTNTSLFAKYEWVFDLAWIVSPELSLSYTYHGRQDTADVFENDNISTTAALRSRNEHLLFGEPAALLFDLEFNLVLRDYKQNHTRPFYSRYYNFVLGERFKFFQAGTTTLSLNAKLSANQDEGLNATDPGFSLSQGYRFGSNINVTGSLGGDYNKARNANNDLINYRLGTSANFTKILNLVDVRLGFDFTYIDTRNQRSTRGYEKTLSPSVSVTRNFSKHFFTGLSYNYTKNHSLDTANYAYSKYIVGLNLGGQF